MTTDDGGLLVDDDKLLVHVIGAREIGDIDTGVGQHVGSNAVGMIANGVVRLWIILAAQIENDIDVNTAPVRIKQLIDEYKRGILLRRILRNPNLKHRNDNSSGRRLDFLLNNT